MNISNETLDKLTDIGFMYSFYNSINWVDDSKDSANEITITDKSTLAMKTIKATKKEMTFDYIMDKISSNKLYIDFSKYFEILLDDKILDCYPTSYGIGIFILYTNENKIKEQYKYVIDKLNELGIKYTTEFSEARWVFRFRISKSKENVEIIKNIIQ